MSTQISYLTFGEPQDTYPVVILIKATDLYKPSIIANYIQPIIDKNPTLKPKDFIALGLDYVKGKAPKKAVAQPCIDKLTPIIEQAKPKSIVCADSNYFKVIAKVTKVTALYGSPLPTDGLPTVDSHSFVVPNYKAAMFDPKANEKIELGVNGAAAHMTGRSIFQEVIHFEEYPRTLKEIKNWLLRIKDEPLLFMDLEAFSLNHYEADVGSFGIAWSQHEGIAFDVALRNTQEDVLVIKKMLREFLEYRVRRKLKQVWHNLNYDGKVLIFELFMNKDLSDKENLLNGVQVMGESFEDTKVIAYLATNSCSRNELSLKQLALPFTGNYGLEEEEITNIRKVPRDTLLKYNLVDCLSTAYVYNKYHPIMVAEQQENIYKELFKPSVKLLLQIESHGMPIIMDKVLYAEQVLELKVKNTLDKLRGNTYGKMLQKLMQMQEYFNCNNKWKTKSEPLSYFKNTPVNFNSSTQLTLLLYHALDLPVIDTTPKGAPACGTKTLKKLINHTDCAELKEFLQLLRDLGKATKILTAFIPAFKNAYYCPEQNFHFLFGNFNLTGTVSGRLSCSNPNLQQIPSNSEYAKLIKDCFGAPDGWLMVGLDFDSLEDYVSALTTKDPNKLKVYTDGYDGHSLRAASYYKDAIVQIDPQFDFSTPEGVNKLKNEKVYGSVRQDSKPCTFALTYQGTWLTLVNNLGLPKKQAQSIEDNFKELYKVSIEWVQKKLDQAHIDGYVVGAFGLRVRTPAIKVSAWGTSKVTKEATKEGRTAGNALGQSYGLLNNRAAVEFQAYTLLSSERLNIWPISLIHDAQYFIIKRNAKTLAFVNKHLVKAVRWQEAPELQHDTVKLGGKLDIFYPTWANGFTLDPDITNPAELAKHAQELFRETQLS